MSDLLAFDNVWLEYGEKIVLERVNLGIAERSFVSIVGPSGSGKSSFLRLALGQETPSRGHILLDGKLLHDLGVLFLGPGTEGVFIVIAKDGVKHGGQASPLS